MVMFFHKIIAQETVLRGCKKIEPVNSYHSRHRIPKGYSPSYLFRQINNSNLFTFNLSNNQNV